MSSLNQNHYRILGVPRDCSKRNIKTAYRKLAFRWHPDMNMHARWATEYFQLIGNAHSTLIDDKKRAAYDCDNPFDLPHQPSILDIIERANAEKYIARLQRKMEGDGVQGRQHESESHRQRRAATRERKPSQPVEENVMEPRATPEEHARRRVQWRIIEANLDIDVVKIKDDIEYLVNQRRALGFGLNGTTQEEQEQRQKLATEIEGLRDRLDTIENYRDCAWEDVWAPLWDQQVEQDIRAEYHARREAGVARRAKASKDKTARKEAAEEEAAKSARTRDEDDTGRCEEQLSHIDLADHGLQRVGTLDGDQKH